MLICIILSYTSAKPPAEVFRERAIRVYTVLHCDIGCLQPKWCCHAFMSALPKLPKAVKSQAPAISTRHSSKSAFHGWMSSQTWAICTDSCTYWNDMDHSGSILQRYLDVLILWLDRVYPNLSFFSPALRFLRVWIICFVEASLQPWKIWAFQQSQATASCHWSTPYRSVRQLCWNVGEGRDAERKKGWYSIEQWSSA